MPNRIKTFVFALFGRAWAYESPATLNEAIDQQAFEQNQTLPAVHAAGARKLDDPYAFQPGLVDLHGELHETWIYLNALEAEARRRGYATLANHLEASASSVIETTCWVAAAAEATIPANPVGDSARR